MDTSAILGALWIIISGILVFFMQAGFTLVETGFTRSKNAGNIIMKNIMDLIVGSIGFWAIGYSVMYGQSIAGFIGTPEIFGLAGTKNYELFFQTVFAATAATIVSGAVAGRTKFSTYIIFSVIMTVIIYPIAGSWQWNGDGWLAQMGFIDFAGSSIVHAVGGWAALIGAIMVGPRIGKYKDGVSQAIPGHNLLLGALGVFILWLGWFGFNGGSQLAFGSEEDVDAVGKVIINTNLAAAAGAAAALFYTWIRYGQPDVSMTLNGALAGLVCITAGCGDVEPGAAAIMGMIAGVVVVISITFIDEKLKIDDPVGAVSVHGVCGTLGTILLGVFAESADLVTQIIGAVAYMVWAIVLAAIVFTILKVTMGLRVSEKEEIEGLDKAEHGIGVYND
ncbi:ammonium transporter [Ochrovirga pacifica]|uniref:ammonium transporter n=1 Tax=Ochrovirga pacifica TaxID=1042376 RepID=UPI0002557B7C|nr:ammonium transporter [Ochrovirga pacifica]